jgi:hypothetical protein
MVSRRELVHAPHRLWRRALCQRVKDRQPSRWPDPARPHKFHLDLGVQDLDRAQHQLLKLSELSIVPDVQARSLLAGEGEHSRALLQRRGLDREAVRTGTVAKTWL